MSKIIVDKNKININFNKIFNIINNSNTKT